MLWINCKFYKMQQNTLRRIHYTFPVAEFLLRKEIASERYRNECSTHDLVKQNSKISWYWFCWKSNIIAIVNVVLCSYNNWDNKLSVVCKNCVYFFCLLRTYNENKIYIIKIINVSKRNTLFYDDNYVMRII